MSLKTNFYLFRSRILTHVVFWFLYYLLFGFLWAGDKGYLASFYLEFLLLPIRMMAVYMVIYLLLPKFLIKGRYKTFFAGYVLVLLMGSVLQRFFIHFFYEELLLNDFSNGLFGIKSLLRAMVLINTTVLLVLGAKLFQLWAVEHEKNKVNENEILEIKANRKTHRIAINTILFIEGLGNYVTFHLEDTSKVTSYGSIKGVLQRLPNNFRRVHKSYIVNKDHIKSYDAMSIDIQNKTIPRGKSVSTEVLLD
ncbi:LytR/AlgR family response regulator transcription factor [Allomuricauda sp. SCSIO 65647]|uniref:LytR/AlgR family response regulator transcription factor n=1 Tax=Allomuricauda sp. SCSIO 65647 TaxID=2908843 RepID=UPI001F278EBB|nr:LytTR family DNA-binding domain-containing protein [Muricauda sp. SCSIO 65647]UJH66042.1 LytTR family transcriptional regulator [Muricauda sp. SCSIO 65647]